MKHHLHKVMELQNYHYVEIYCDSEALIFITDDDNYNNYILDEDYDYYGDEVRTSPFFIAPPHAGRWHLVVEQLNPKTTLNIRIQIKEKG